MAYIPLHATELTDKERNNTVNAETINTFPQPDSSIITLDDLVHYAITKPINVITNQLKVEDNGAVQFSTTNAVANVLSTDLTGTTPLFFGEISRFEMENVNNISNNSGGTFWDFSKGGAVPRGLILFNDSTVQRFNSIGTLDGLTFVSENVGWILNEEGLTLNNMGLVQMSEHAFNAQTGDHIIITGTLGDGNFNRTVAAPSTGDALFNIASDLDITNKITITDSFFSDVNGGTLFAAGSKDQTDPHVVCFNNGNAIDSFWVGSTGFTGGTTATVLADTVTFVKIAGTYVDGYTERFSFVNGVGTYDGLEKIYVDARASVKLLLEPGIETDIVQVSIFKNGSEIAVSRVQQSLTDVFQTPTSPEFSCSENILLENGDTFELRMRNTSNATNVTATDAKITVRK